MSDTASTSTKESNSVGIHRSDSIATCENTEDKLEKDPPMYSDWVDLERREKSFNNREWRWMRKEKKFEASDEIFAKAGLFYDPGDSVLICFYCGGRLKDFATTDKPVEEHMKYYPSCPYLIREYSAEEIAVVNEKYKNIQRPNQLPMDNIKRVEHNPDVLPMPSPLVDPNSYKNELFEQAMASTPARKAQEMGFSLQQVKDTMWRKISQDECYYETFEGLLEELNPDSPSP